MPAAATAGVVSNRVYFIYGEHHANGPMLLRFYITLVVVLFATQITIGGSSTTAASKETAMLVTVYVISIFASMVTYRCLFHPLKSFPGPFGARVSKFWHAYHVRDSKNHLFLHRLHEDYGDFIRTSKYHTMLEASCIQLKAVWD